MPKSTLVVESNARSLAGDELIERAKSAGASALRKTLTRFEAQHTKFKGLSAAVAAAERAALAADEATGTADDAQDAAIDDLANALILTGRPRSSPFRGLSPVPPARMQALAVTREAEALIAVANKCLALRDAGLKEPARKALAAAKAAQRAAAASAKASAAWSKAIEARRAVEPAWEKARASVYRTARFLDAEAETTGLHDALVSGTAPRKKAGKVTPAPAPSPAPGK